LERCAPSIPRFLRYRGPQRQVLVVAVINGWEGVLHFFGAGSVRGIKFAHNFLLRAHNGGSHKSEAQMTLQSPMRANLFHVLCSLYFPLFFPQNSSHPHPPYLWKSFFDLFIPCNLQEINNMHFSPVDESVTANPVFCQLLTQKEAILTQKALIFAFSQHSQIPQSGIFRSQRQPTACERVASDCPTAGGRRWPQTQD
jgi:hypothetical protein